MLAMQKGSTTMQAMEKTGKLKNAKNKGLLSGPLSFGGEHKIALSPSR